MNQMNCSLFFNWIKEEPTDGVLGQQNLQTWFCGQNQVCPPGTVDGVLQSFVLTWCRSTNDSSYIRDQCSTAHAQTFITILCLSPSRSLSSSGWTQSDCQIRTRMELCCRTSAVLLLLLLPGKNSIMWVCARVGPGPEPEPDPPLVLVPELRHKVLMLYSENRAGSMEVLD